MVSGLIDRRLIRHFDWSIFLALLLLPVVSLTVLYSAGFDPDREISLGILPFVIKSQPFLKQLIFVLVGLVALIIGAAVPTHIFSRYAILVYGTGIVLLLAVLLIGLEVNGARRWLALGGGFNLQPAEFMKVGVMLFMARYISKLPPKGLYGFKELIIPVLIVGIPMALIMKQPDLGSAIAVGAAGGLMILFVGVRPRVILTVLLLCVIMAPIMWGKLHAYQQRRILTLIDPGSDPRGSGYHITQSMIAVGSGELSGKGFLRGTQSQLEFLPEHTTDFVFSVLAEEWGFMGGGFLIAIYAFLVQRLLRVTSRSKDLFSGLIVFGVASVVAFHALINIGMVIGIFPVVGIPLPLVSYGGSAVVTLFFLFGIALGVGMRRLSFVQVAT